MMVMMMMMNLDHHCRWEWMTRTRHILADEDTSDVRRSPLVCRGEATRRDLISCTVLPVNCVERYVVARS